MGTFIEESRKNWVPHAGLQISDEQLQIGCLQRIANATEAMAKYHTSLIHDLELYKKWYGERGQEIEELKRIISAQKGVITKLKKKLQTQGQL